MEDSNTVTPPDAELVWETPGSVRLMLAKAGGRCAVDFPHQRDTSRQLRLVLPVQALQLLADQLQTMLAEAAAASLPPRRH